MLQDLDFGTLDNQYHEQTPTVQDTVVCFRGSDILIARDGQDRLQLPTLAQVQAWSKTWQDWGLGQFRYLFQMQEGNYFLWMGEAGEPEDLAFAYEPTGKLRQLISKNICFAAMTAWHLFTWYRSSRYCGQCGTKTTHDSVERMMRCPNCGNMIFPRISPAVIVAITNGDRIVMSKYAGRSYTRYALIAGFTEIGETPEQTVAREVMEEVGLKVKNIRYYKSQPWGIAGNLLLGFYCDLDGDDTIHLDEQELSMAQWFPRDAMPVQDDGISLTREMMRIFSEGKEPK